MKNSIHPGVLLLLGLFLWLMGGVFGGFAGSLIVVTGFTFVLLAIAGFIQGAFKKKEPKE